MYFINAFPHLDSSLTPHVLHCLTRNVLLTTYASTSAAPSHWALSGSPIGRPDVPRCRAARAWRHRAGAERAHPHPQSVRTRWHTRRASCTDRRLTAYPPTPRRACPAVRASGSPPTRALHCSRCFSLHGHPSATLQVPMSTLCPRSSTGLDAIRTAPTITCADLRAALACG